MSEWSDDDSHSSSVSGSSNSSGSNGGPSSPAQEDRSPMKDSNSMPDKPDSNHENQSMSPTRETNEEERQEEEEQTGEGEGGKSVEDDDEEELELSDIDEESSKQKKADISHEDLSDISDLDDSDGPASPAENFTDLRQKLEKRRQNGSSIDKDSNKNDDDELDFEADEVKDTTENSVKKPPQDTNSNKESGNGSASAKEDGEHKSDNELESGEELEEGEVTDGDEKRPEESEPKAVCRFFTRGQCTWGMSCRFLHPGTTDKGNYTMFDLVRPIPVPQAGPPMMMPSYDYRNERPIHHMPPHVYGPPRAGGPPPAVADSESAWERGLRTAKEMMRKANKRKEQDMDFDEKKMNLSGPPDEIERDPYYARGSPEDLYERGPPVRGGPRPAAGAFDYSPPHKFARAGPAYYEEDQYGRMPRPYRELPAHRMPHYEDEDIGKRRTVRTHREVIVEKASDEWNDPWMRKSQGRAGEKDRKVRTGERGRERSYSSNSSYSSSSSSSRSRSSSDSSRSPNRNRRFDPKRSKERGAKVERPKSRSSSLKRRHSPTRRVSKKAASPVVIPKRKRAASPPIRAEKRAHSRKKRDSSSSSGSESDSSYSSSTSSSKGKRRREKLVSERKPVAAKKVEMTKKRTTTPPPSKDDDKDKEKTEKASAAAKLKSSRREELLKQLKAVEDAIARKRSKIN